MDMEKMVKALERRVRTIEVHKDKVRGWGRRRRPGRTHCLVLDHSAAWTHANMWLCRVGGNLAVST